jgi:hypothetical protein
LKDILISAYYVMLWFDSYTSIDRDDNKLLLIVIEKKVEWCKIMELFKNIRYKLIELKILFPMRLLLSEAKLWSN